MNRELAVKIHLAMSRKAQRRTSLENIADVLEAMSSVNPRPVQIVNVRLHGADVVGVDGPFITAQQAAAFAAISTSIARVRVVTTRLNPPGP